MFGVRLRHPAGPGRPSLQALSGDVVTTALWVFLVQATYVLVLGLQSRFVHSGNVWGAATGSFVLGLGGLFVYSSLAKAAVHGDPAVQVAYVLAGPPAIVLAIHLHVRFSRKADDGED